MKRSLKCFLSLITCVAATGSTTNVNACDGGYGFRPRPQFRAPVCFRASRYNLDRHVEIEIEEPPVFEVESAPVHFRGASRVRAAAPWNDRLPPTSQRGVRSQPGFENEPSAPINERLTQRGAPSQYDIDPSYAGQQSRQPQPTFRGNDAAISALEALGQYSGGASEPGYAQESGRDYSNEAPASDLDYSGTWTADAAENVTIQLSLSSEGSFRWLVLNNGETASEFEGSYTISGGELTLIRSTDGQELGGAMSNLGSDSFTFSPPSGSASALNFARS